MPESSLPTAIPDFWAIIPAGGSGTRLWPLSRESSPKFLHDLIGSGQSLLQATADRLAPLCEDRMMVVTGVPHVDAVREQLPTLGIEKLLAEPSRRESLPAIGLAAAILAQHEPEAILGSFAADHVISGVVAFRECVTEAVQVARTGKLVTIGIEPDRPSTGFGYIEVGDELVVEGSPGVRKVNAFVEKPDGATAQLYFESGAYWWNAGMFVVRAETLMELIAHYQPRLAEYLREIAIRPIRLSELWPRLTKITIDNAIAEPASVDGHVAVIPATFIWADVGDFASLATLLMDRQDEPGVKVLGESELVVMRDATGVVAPGSGRTVVALGIHDVVIVDTMDAVLVTTRGNAQDVKKLVEQLKLGGRAHLT